MTKEERARLRTLIANDRSDTAMMNMGSGAVIRPMASSPWVRVAESLLDTIDAAEARVERLEAALREIRDNGVTPLWVFPIIEAALAKPEGMS